MNRRQSLQTISAATAPGLLGAAKPPSYPNIVFIYADDLGYGDVGCYGATSTSSLSQRDERQRSSQTVQDETQPRTGHGDRRGCQPDWLHGGRQVSSLGGQRYRGHSQLQAVAFISEYEDRTNAPNAQLYDRSADPREKHNVEMHIPRSSIACWQSSIRFNPRVAANHNVFYCLEKTTLAAKLTL